MHRVAMGGEDDIGVADAPRPRQAFNHPHKPVGQGGSAEMLDKKLLPVCEEFEPGQTRYAHASPEPFRSLSDSDGQDASVHAIQSLSQKGLKIIDLSKHTTDAVVSQRHGGPLSCNIRSG